jgi:hypothetical protein
LFATGDDEAARMRHELHTPLTSILAYTRLLRDDLAGDDVLSDGVACLDAARAHIEIRLRRDPRPSIDARVVPNGELTAAPQRRSSDPRRPADLQVARAVANLCGGDVRLDETSFRLALPATVLAPAPR